MPHISRGTHVMKLAHAINGTKQSGKEFHDKLDRVFVNELKFKRNTKDPCTYSKGKEKDGTQLIVVCHVDDYQYVGMSRKVEEQFEREIQKHLPSVCGKPCEEHLGMQINQDDDGATHFNQEYRITEYARRLQITEPTKRLRVLNLNHTSSVLMKEPSKYAQAIGCLNYLTCNSRPDRR